MNKDTFYFARSSGDRSFILWLRDRLVHVYDESPNVDFVLTLTDFVEAGARLKEAYDELERYHIKVHRPSLNKQYPKICLDCQKLLEGVPIDEPCIVK